MGSDVLIDSNVYIDLLRVRKDPVATLYQWGEAHGRDLAICGMIRVEVLRGLKLLRSYHSISALMDVMINIPSDNRMWTAATELAWSLDRKGIVIPGADAVIAASALRHGAAIMSSDAHFSRIEGLRLISPPIDWFGK